LACVLVGGGLTWVGYKLKAPYERPPGATGFAGPIFSRLLLIEGAANLLVVVGLIIAVVFSLIFFLT
jgi:hypothetical protein